MYTLQGLDNLLDRVINTAHFALKVHLFKNNVTVDKNTVLTDLTESTFTGYAAIAGVAWGAIANNGSDEAASDGPELTWTCTADGAAQQAFGYYVTFLKQDGATRVLLTAGNFSAPTTIAFNGDFVKKKLNWRDKNYNP